MLLNPGNGQFDDAERVELTEWDGSSFDELAVHKDADGNRFLYAWKDGDAGTSLRRITWGSSSTTVADRSLTDLGFTTITDVTHASLSKNGQSTTYYYQVHASTSQVVIQGLTGGTVTGFTGTIQKVRFGDITGDGWPDMVVATSRGIYAIPYVYPGSATASPYSAANIVQIGLGWGEGERVVSTLEVPDIDGNGVPLLFENL